VATLLVIPILMACSCVEHSIGYASAAVTITPMAAEETKTAGNDDNIKPDVKNKDCKDNNKDNNDDNSKKQDACSDSKSKDTPTSKSSDDTSVTPHKDDDNKKQKDPFLLPFP
jgi:hypothetical protein